MSIHGVLGRSAWSGFQFGMWLVLVVGLSAASVWAGPSTVVPKFDDKGLSGVMVDGKLVPLFTGQVGFRPTLTREYRNPYEMADPYVADTRELRRVDEPPTRSVFDAARKALTHVYPWGQVNVTYTANPEAGGLDVRLEIQNTGTEVIESMHMTVMALGKGEGVLDQKRYGDPINVNGVNLLTVDPNAQAGLPQVVVGSSQPNRPLYLGWEGVHAASKAARLVVTFGPAPGSSGERLDGIWNFRAIKPGATEIVELCFRFGPAGEEPTKTAADLFNAFTKAAPFKLRWPDRRPITMIQLEYGRGEQNNPRGWWGLKDSKEDIRTPEGKAVFTKWLMTSADNAIKVAEKAGAQGVIVWDVEGGQYPGNKYYGDPRIMQYTAPEMEEHADAYFKKLRDAGLRVGVCLRPHWNLPIDVPSDQVMKYQHPNNFQDMPFRMTWDRFNIESWGLEFIGYDEIAHDSKTPLTDVKRSPVQRLDDMITYSKKRWGATLFYVDTNSFMRPRSKSKPNAQGGYDELGPWTKLLMSAQQWAELQRRHPDVLLMPEHQNDQYYSVTAPYNQIGYDGPTPPYVTQIYPESFSALSIAQQGNTFDGMPYVPAVQRGDLLITIGWFGPQPSLLTIYAAAAATAPVRVEIKADGKLTLQGQPVAEIKDLEKKVNEQVKGRPFAERRAVMQYAPGTDALVRSAVVEALERADAIIAWSQPSDVVLPTAPTAPSTVADPKGPATVSASNRAANAPIQIVLHADLRIVGTNSGGGEFLLAWLASTDGSTRPDVTRLTREVKAWVEGKPAAERRVSLKIFGGDTHRDAVVSALRQAGAEDVSVQEVK